MPILEEVLESLTVRDLKERAKLVEGRPEGNLKAQWIAFLAASIRRDLDDILEEMDARERAAVAHLVHGDWEELDLAKFRLIHGGLPSWIVKGQQRRRHSHSRRELERPDLLFYGGRIPEDLHPQIAPRVEPPARVEIELVEELGKGFELEGWEDQGRTWPWNVHEGEALAPREVAAALQLAQAGKLRQTKKTRVPTKASLRKVTGELLAPDFLSTEREWEGYEEDWLMSEEGIDVGPVRAFALQAMLVGGGFVNASGKKSALTRKGERLLKRPDHQRIKMLWEAWLVQDDFDELARIDRVKGQTGKAARKLTSASTRRPPIVEMLRACTPGKWLMCAELFKHMKLRDLLPQLASKSEGIWELYIYHREYGSLGYDGGPRVLQRAYTRAFLFEYAATLGLIDIAYVSPEKVSPRWHKYWWGNDLSYLSRYDGLGAIRLTSLGAWVLGQTEEYERATEVTETIKVLPNRDVVTPRDVHLTTRVMLDLYASSTGDHTWHIERDSLLEAVAQGHDLEGFETFLIQNA